MTKTRNRKILTIILSLLFSVSLFIGFGMMSMFNVSAERGYWEEEYEEEITTPYWNRDIIYNEIALPFIDSTGFVVANLMYTPLEIVAVKDQTLGITYVEGKDYTVDATGKRLIIPMRTSDIPVIAIDADTNPETVPAGYNEVNSFNSVFVGYYVFDSNGDSNYSTGNQVIYTESSLFYSKYLSITYTYNRSEVDREAMTRYDKTKLTNLRAKLERGEDIDMLVLGDSITAGCSTTGSYLSEGAPAGYFGEDILPGTPGYAWQVANEIEKIYGVNVNLKNLAVGGALSDYSLVEHDKYNNSDGGYNAFISALDEVSSAGRTYDLCIIAFGMNDAGSTAMHNVLVWDDETQSYVVDQLSVKDFYARNIRAYIQTIKGEMDIYQIGDKVDGKCQYYDGRLRAANIGVGRSPDCDFILVNSYPRNTEYDSWGGLTGANSPANASNNYKNFKIELQDNINKYAKGSVVVDMYKVADSILSTDLGVSNQNGTKRYCEISSTNFNHPNDWMHRIYAMNIVSAIYDYSDENFPLLYRATQHDEAGTSFTYTNEIYDYAYGLNGWAAYQQQYVEDGAGGIVYVDKNYDVDIAQTYGYINRIDYGNVNQFHMQNSGWLINYLGYDVSKTIEFRFHVTAAGYRDSFVGNTATGRTSYGFAFSSSVLDALKTANHMYDANNKDNLSKISFWGANCDTTDFGLPINLFGRLWNVQTGAMLGANNGESSFLDYATEAARTAANPGIAQEGFMTVRITIGETNTTVSLVDRYITNFSGIPYYAENVLRTITIDTVSRADFPTGFAYMSFAVIDLDGKDGTNSVGTAVVSLEDTRFGPYLVNATAGKSFPDHYLADGWAVVTNTENSYYINASGSYKNYMQEDIVRQGFGNFGFASLDDGTMHDSGQHWNLRAYDVTKPINIQYTYTHTPGTTVAQGWYAIQLWDNIEAMLSDNLQWHDDFSLSKIHITGGNYVRAGIADNANGLNFFPNNAKYPRLGSILNTSWGYNYANFDWSDMFVNLHIVIGETKTVITVNNQGPDAEVPLVVELPLKQSDFAHGKAYLSLSISNDESATSKKFYVKMWNLDRGAYATDANGNPFEHKPDENGWDTYRQNIGTTYTGLLGNQRVATNYGVNAIYSGLRPNGNAIAGKYEHSEIWLSNSGSVVNYKPLDIHEAVELTYSITAPSVNSGYVSWYAISFFDNLDDALIASTSVWDYRASKTTGAKLTILGGNGNIYNNFAGNKVIGDRGSFQDVLLINPYGNHPEADLLIEHNTGFGSGLTWSNEKKLRIYIDENKTRIYDANTKATHTIEDLTWADFSDGTMYAHIVMSNSKDNATSTTLAFNVNLNQKYIPDYTETGFDKHEKYYGYTFEDGAFDAANSTGVITADGTNDTAFITQGSYIINKNTYDVTKEFEIKINTGSGGWGSSQYGAWMVGMFERRQYMHDVGEEMWDVVTHGDKVKVLFGGSSAQESGLVPNVKDEHGNPIEVADQHAYLRNTIYPKTKTINTDLIDNKQTGFDYIGGTLNNETKIEENVKYVTLHVYIPSEDHVEQGYIKADGRLIISGADMDITQEDFVSDRVFLSFYSYGLTRWRVNVKQYEPTVVTNSVNLGSDLSTNYFVKLGTRYANPVVDYSFETSYPYSGTLTPTMQDGRYVYKFDQLNAMHMTVGVDVTLKATNISSGEQEVLYAVEDYSMRDYVEGLLAKTTYAKNPKLVTLLVDFLNYGAEAQKMNYAKAVSEGISTDKAAAMYRTSDLANKNLTAAQKAYATAYVAQTDTKTSTIDANSVRGWQRSIWCNETTGVYLKFNVNKELTAEQIQIKVYVDDVLQTTVDGANLVNVGETGSGHKIYEIKHSVAASMFASKVKFEVWTNANGAGFVKSNVYYNTSINDWIASEVGQTGEVDFAKALWSFGQSSKAYSDMLAGL